ncbi:MAG: thioredoxin domain-containing protein [Nitrospinae bacterium]|nr:thioredoxin domain-containing protein [Nitrospinota bacterium]
MSKHANRLAQEQSPYLLQHAHNPVDWFPWGDEAFAKAAREDKPVFLSIGYATCHWCHVMERESFEDEGVARLLNQSFVSIKVDREERPDIDGVYMTVCQMLTGAGGWPLTIIMTPGKKPFFAATYIGKHATRGLMGMMDLLPRIVDLWKNHRGTLAESAEKVTEGLQRHSAASQSGAAEEGLLREAYEGLATTYDDEYGGFSRAPKFPVPHNLMFLLRYWKRTGEVKALAMVEKTLTAMRHGGIYDHVGFGFHRYSTDRRWLVPHFEKMLYDQALLAIAYAEAFQATLNPLFARTARETLSYILRKMAGPECAFYSAEDADSEGVEGKFYVWRTGEVADALGEEEGELISGLFHMREDGNYADEADGGLTGANIPHLPKTVEEYAALTDIDPKMLKARLETARIRLFNAREKRVPPLLDDKILTDWNGLALAALGKGARVFGDASFAREAARAADFLLHTMRRPDGTLLHRYRKGEAAIPGNLDDYAFLTWGLIELYEAVFDPKYLRAAKELADTMLRLFADEAGGFYFTPAGGEALLARRKDIYDGALPSGNAVAALNLSRLARFTGDESYARHADKTLAAFGGAFGKNPDAYGFSMIALDFALGPTAEVVIASPGDAEHAAALLKPLNAPFAPRRVVLFAGKDEAAALAAIAPYTKGMTPVDGEAAAYVCRNFTCAMPVADPLKMTELLEK